MKILILGGAGFIGYHLASKLSSMKGKYIEIIDNFQRGKKDVYFKKLVGKKNVKYRKLDLLNNKEILKLKSNFDYIFFLSAIVGVKNVISNPYDVLHKNIVMTINAINFAKKNKKLKRFIFFSTSEVYSGSIGSDFFKIPTEEDTKICLNKFNDSRSTYMLSKIYGENLCHHSQLNFTIVRPHNFYGPRMGMSHVIPEKLKEITEKKNKKIKVYSPNNTRTFIFIDDAIKIINELTFKKNTNKKTFNIGNEKPEYKILDLVKLCMKVVGIKKKIILSKNKDKILRRSPSLKYTNKFVKYKSKFDLENGVLRTYLWYKKNF